MQYNPALVAGFSFALFISQKKFQKKLLCFCSGVTDGVIEILRKRFFASPTPSGWDPFPDTLLNY
jgi:hypothetical protein